MAKATIKSKTGAVITVEGTDKEISDILSPSSGQPQWVRPKVAIAHGRAAKKEQKKRASVSDLVVTLKEEDFSISRKDCRIFQMPLKSRDTFAQ